MLVARKTAMALGIALRLDSLLRWRTAGRCPTRWPLRHSGVRRHFHDAARTGLALGRLGRACEHSGGPLGLTPRASTTPASVKVELDVPYG